MAFVSHKGEHDERFKVALEKALGLVGGEAERRAKETISDMGAVDTGFLRNSITWAIAGKTANTGSYTDDAGVQHGSYSWTAPTESGDATVYIGSNVEYAPYVEFGTTRMAARPFLASSIQSGQDTYTKIFQQAFEHFMD